MTKTRRSIPLPARPPRNPLVAPSLCRGGAVRQCQRRALRHELQDLHLPHY
jgi:hypothetical protein